MKHLVRRHAIILAALLQVLPIVRNIVTNPTATSTFAIILRWSIGTTAAVGAYDACSASSIPVFVTPTNFYGTVGVYFTNSIMITNVGTDPGAYFNLYNSNFTAIVTHISNNVVTTVTMPAGLSFKCIDGYNKNPPYVLGSIYGTPTAPVTHLFVHVQAGHPAYGTATIDMTNYFTIYPASANSPPTITNQPVDATIVAGGTTNFSVLAGGTAPLSYQWFFNTNASLFNATNTSLGLTNILRRQAGTYSVVITNGSGAATSSPARLTVTLPPSPAIVAPGTASGLFKFTFNPVVGLTNSVVTNSTLTGGSWAVMTNVPPPVTANPVTVFDTISGTNRFYRVQLNP